jgi:hypothetical protein
MPADATAEQVERINTRDRQFVRLSFRCDRTALARVRPVQYCCAGHLGCCKRMTRHCSHRLAGEPVRLRPRHIVADSHSVPELKLEALELGPRSSLLRQVTFQRRVKVLSCGKQGRHSTFKGLGLVGIPAAITTIVRQNADISSFHELGGPARSAASTLVLLTRNA